MNYYKIVINSDLPVTGKYPQVKDIKIDFHKARASQWGKITSWKSDDDIPDLDNFVFQKGAKLTDLLSNSFVIITSGIFISEDARKIIESFKINGNFYPMTVFMGDTPHKYNFLWYEMNGNSKIDWDKSTFEEYNKEKDHKGKVISVKDSEDYKDKFREMYSVKGDDWDIVTKKLTFKEHFDLTPAFGIGLICNEKVKAAIEENKLTGFLFKPVDIEIIFEQ